MAEPQWEPTQEAVDALAKEMCEVYGTGDEESEQWPHLDSQQLAGYRAEARFILRRQHERENTLRAAAAAAVERAMESHSPYKFSEREFRKYMDPFDAAHAKLDAPKVPTLLEAAKEAIKGVRDEAYFHVEGGALYALKAAVEREDANRR